MLSQYVTIIGSISDESDIFTTFWIRMCQFINLSNEIFKHQPVLSIFRQYEFFQKGPLKGKRPAFSILHNNNKLENMWHSRSSYS